MIRVVDTNAGFCDADSRITKILGAEDLLALPAAWVWGEWEIIAQIIGTCSPFVGETFRTVNIPPPRGGYFLARKIEKETASP